ncbi:MAG: hypothetical protein ACREFA_14145 [Stellaceae bacterium]
MRSDLIETMVRDGFSSGTGALLAQIAAALDALDNASQSLAERASSAARDIPSDALS